MSTTQNTSSPALSTVADQDSKSRDALASLAIKRPDPNTRRKRKWPWILVLLLIGGGAVVGYRFIADRQANGEMGAGWVPDIIQNRPQVQLASVTLQSGRSGDAVVVATGYLESRRQARIGARAPGRIEIIHFEEGSKVKRNDLLAVLEHADLLASLAATSASVSRAKAALAEQEITIEQMLREKKRADSLWRQSSISEVERDQAVYAFQSAVARKDSLAADVELAAARMREAEQLKENMFIRAPFDGTVISKDAEVGESILPGGMGEASGRGSVATIADLANLEVECDVKEDYISRVVEGQQTEIKVDAVPNRKYHGTVRKVIPMGDRARATIKVQVAITDADELLFPEMSGTVYFLPESSDPENDAERDVDKARLFCPTNAIVTGENGEVFVWTVDDKRHLQRINVEAGDKRDGKTEILSGLKPGTRVVTNPKQWNPGQAVKVIE